MRSIKLIFSNLVAVALTLIMTTSFAWSVEVEPTPKFPADEALERIQNTGGAIKMEEAPAIQPEEAVPKQPSDPAMNVIEYATEENRNNLPVEAPQHYWGPSLHVGFPHPLNLGILYIHSSKYFSAEASFGQMPFKYQDATVKIENTEYNLRYHPWANAFFVGFGYGKQKINIKQTETVSAQEVEAEIEFTSDYMLPHVGWMSGVEKGGFFWAFELGWQTPSNGKTELTTSVDLSGDPDYDELVGDVRDAVKKTGKKSVPNIALIKFGWLF